MHSLTHTFMTTLTINITTGSTFSPSEAVCIAIGCLPQEPRHVDSLIMIMQIAIPASSKFWSCNTFCSGYIFTTCLNVLKFYCT